MFKSGFTLIQSLALIDFCNAGMGASVPPTAPVTGKGDLAAYSSAGTTVRKPFGEAEWRRSAVPLRPGEPGKAPFWNAYAKRFIYAPVFDFNRVEGGVKYQPCASRPMPVGCA